MDVKQIRDEILKIDTLLVSVDEDLKRINETSDDIDTTSRIEAEYLTLLSCLSNTVPFSSLMTDHQEEASPDAFTFFGLIQAFLEDKLVLKSLCAIFKDISAVTQTQLEDTLRMVSEGEFENRDLLLKAVVDRICQEMLHGKILQPELLVEACRLMRNIDVLYMPTDVVQLATSNLSVWPLSVHAELASFLQLFHSTEYIAKVSSLLAVAIRENEWTSVRVVWQTLELLSPDQVDGDSVLLLAEKCLKFPIPQKTDVHHLAIQMGKFNLKSKPVWTLLVEKFSIPVFEVPKTLAAFTKMGITFDGIFTNLVAFKKRVQAMKLPSELEEIADHLILAGDKSVGSLITKALMERRDLYVLKGDEEIFKIPVLCKVLLASVVASVDSGTVIPDSIMLLRKYQKLIIDYLQKNNQSESVQLLFHLLLPNQIPIPPISNVPQNGVIHDRITRILNVLGFVPGQSDSALQLAATVEGGLFVDFAFPNEQVGIVVEEQAVALVSARGRNVLRGLTALKTNILSQRKGWKIIIVLPEMFPDDKSLTALLVEPLRKLPINSVVNFHSMEGMSLNISQRIHRLIVSCSSLVEISKFLFLILKYSIVVHEFVFDVRLTDQFLNLVFSDFISTYLVKNKHPVRIDVSKNSFTFNVLGHFLSGIDSVASSSMGIAPVELALGNHKGVDPDLHTLEWARSAKTVALKKVLNEEDSKNVILFINR